MSLLGYTNHMIRAMHCDQSHRSHDGNCLIAIIVTETQEMCSIQPSTNPLLANAIINVIGETLLWVSEITQFEV